MASLKDAFLKAGIKPTEAPKKQNEREKIAKKHVTEAVTHQGHRNPTTEAEWICVRCADQLQILDKFRQTAQSDTSIKKMFRREYGETIKIASNTITTGGSKPRGDYDGNR